MVIACCQDAPRGRTQDRDAPRGNTQDQDAHRGRTQDQDDAWHEGAVAECVCVFVCAHLRLRVLCVSIIACNLALLTCSSLRRRVRVRAAGDLKSGVAAKYRKCFGAHFTQSFADGAV